MPSGMDAMSAIAAIGSTIIVTAAEGVTIGAVKRLTTARIESRRGNRVQDFTPTTWHMVRCKRRSPASHFCQVMLGDILARKWLCEPYRENYAQHPRRPDCWLGDSIRILM